MASSITQTHKGTGTIRRVEGLITFHTDGTFTATALAYSFEGRLLWLETNPGPTAPTDNYDISLVDADGADRLLGVGQNRDTANTELVAIVNATGNHPVVDSDEYTTLLWTITGNAVNGATVGYKLFYSPGTVS